MIKNLHLLKYDNYGGNMDNIAVQKVDIMAYAGKWFSLYTIPGLFDKDWKHTTHTYVIHPDGYYAVFTNYKLPTDNKQRYIRSKLSVIRGSGNARMKAQVVWPFKTDYWVIELADDYSHAVIGHPRCKHLSILSRKAEIEASLLSAIIERCHEKGYDTSKLVSQEHKDTPVLDVIPA